MNDRMVATWKLLRGVLTAALISLALMALLAVAVVYVRLSDETITVVNQVIKLLSLFAGVLVCVRPGGRRGFFLGAAVGLLYMAVGYGLYCLLDDVMLPFGMLAVEFSVGALAGALSGALVSNLPPRRPRVAGASGRRSA